MFQLILKKLKQRRPWALGLAALLGTSLLSGCGGSSDDGGASADSGEIVIGLTDAEGDFLNYAVDVLSIKLTRADGTEVETLPLNSRIDFAQYVDMTEFVTAATIPSGRYVRASLMLDYGDADVQVEVSGNPTAADLVDADGNPVTTLEMAVKLEGRNALVIAPGIPAHLTLDFDLDASHRVDTTATPPVATVEPMLLADINLQDPKPHRLRGLLDEVDQAHNHIQLTMRPLLHRLGRFGHLKAHVDADTMYEINGTSYQGDAGLIAMSELAQNTWTVVIGMPNRTTRDFLATEVYAGSSVPGGDQDSVIGVVTARNGDQLSVDAGAVVTAEGRLAFHQNITINLNPDTPVSRQLSQGEFGKDDISVGQRIAAIGELTQTTMTAPRHVRMLMNDIAGDVIENNGAELAIDLQDMNGRRSGVFDFTGTGTDPTQDADPSNYQVAISSLSLDNIAAPDPVRVRGFVTPFGTAPADFEAQSVINLADVRAALFVSWEAPSSAPFSSQSDTALVIDLADTGRHHVKRRRMITDLTKFDLPPTLQPDEDGNGIFAIRQTGAIQIYRQFDDFSRALSEALDGAVGISRIHAQGHFDDSTATFTSRVIRVILEPVAP